MYHVIHMSLYYQYKQYNIERGQFYYVTTVTKIDRDNMEVCLGALDLSDESSAYSEIESEIESGSIDHNSSGHYHINRSVLKAAGRGTGLN